MFESGPPADAWLSEVEEGYRYRYWIVEINVTVEFIAVTYEQWMLNHSNRLILRCGRSRRLLRPEPQQL